MAGRLEPPLGWPCTTTFGIALDTEDQVPRHKPPSISLPNNSNPGIVDAVFTTGRPHILGESGISTN